MTGKAVDAVLSELTRSLTVNCWLQLFARLSLVERSLGKDPAVRGSDGRCDEPLPRYVTAIAVLVAGVVLVSHVCDVDHVGHGDLRALSDRRHSGLVASSACSNFLLSHTTSGKSRMVRALAAAVTVALCAVLS